MDDIKNLFVETSWGDVRKQLEDWGYDADKVMNKAAENLVRWESLSDEERETINKKDVEAFAKSLVNDSYLDCAIITDEQGS